MIYKKEDILDSVNELPFVIVGSGLAAIEVSYALRKRWRGRSLKLLCDSRKINNKILKSLRNSNIDVVQNLNFDYGKILLCTGNTSPSWVQKIFRFGFSWKNNHKSEFAVEKFLRDLCCG